MAGVEWARNLAPASWRRSDTLSNAGTAGRMD
jgi:hypothetical protein